MKNLRIIGGLMVIVTFSAVLSAQTYARLVTRSGTVEVLRGSVWVQILPNEPIYLGERIRTGSASAATMELGIGRIITLNERTEIEVRDLNGSPAVQLNAGNMKVVSDADIQVSTKETTFESAERPLDIEVGYQGDKPNLRVITGAVRTGAIVVRGPGDTTTRTYLAGGRLMGCPSPIVYPNFNFYPYVIYGGPAAQNLPNPPIPNYVPGQIVPPMTDPLRPPVHYPDNPFPYRPPGTR